MAIGPQQIELLIPLAIQWAAEEEANVLKIGEPLTQNETEYAEKIGVRFPAKVRLLKVSAMPSPKNPTLKRAAAEMGSTLSEANGLTLGYAIFIRQTYWRQLRLVVHELVHTQQYERAGGLGLLREFVLEYPNYPNGPLEQEARSAERRFFGPT